MLASEACTGATAQSRGPWGVLSHTLTYFAQLYGEIRNNNNTSSLLLGFPWSVSPGPRHQSPGGGVTHSLQTPRLLLGDWNYPCEVNSFAGYNSSIDRQAKYAWISEESLWNIDCVFFLSLRSSSSSFSMPLGVRDVFIASPGQNLKLRSVVTAPVRRNGKRRSKLLPPLAEQKLFRSQCGPATLMVTHP